MKKREIELNGKKYIIAFLDGENKPCEEDEAIMVSISEYDKYDNFIKNVIGTIKK